MLGNVALEPMEQAVLDEYHGIGRLCGSDEAPLAYGGPDDGVATAQTGHGAWKRSCRACECWRPLPQLCDDGAGFTAARSRARPYM